MYRSMGALSDQISTLVANSTAQQQMVNSLVEDSGKNQRQLADISERLVVLEQHRNMFADNPSDTSSSSSSSSQESSESSSNERKV